MTADLANNPQVCAALREEIERYHSKRVEMLDNKTRIKSVRRKGIPSIKVRESFQTKKRGNLGNGPIRGGDAGGNKSKRSQVSVGKSSKKSQLPEGTKCIIK